MRRRLNYTRRVTTRSCERSPSKSVPAIDASLADAVISALARLTRQHVSQGRGADGFFCRVRRTLSDLIDDELAALRSLADYVAVLDVAVSQTQIGLECLPGEGQSSPQLRYLRPLPEEEKNRRSTANEIALIGQPQHALRPFHLLKVNDLALDGTSGGIGKFTRPEVVEVRST